MDTSCINDLVNEDSDKVSGKDWLKYSISVWDDSKTFQEKLYGHPASFPLTLVDKLVRIYSKQNELIIDPFMGTGSTLVVSSELQRCSIGFDINESYINLASDRLSTYSTNYRVINDSCINLDKYILPESVDLCITSPPYWDILNQTRSADYKETKNYGNSAEDLGNIHDYNLFLKGMEQVFFKVYHSLKYNKHCILIVMDIRKKNRFYPLHIDITSIMTGIGFQLEDFIIWDRRKEYNNLRPLGYPHVFRVNKTHEYICIFKKTGGA